MSVKLWWKRGHNINAYIDLAELYLHLSYKIVPRRTVERCLDWLVSKTGETV